MTTKSTSPQDTLLQQLLAYTQQATTTADPKAFDHDYLIPGIVGEVGELFGQGAKAHWHEWDADELQAQLVKEYGDIAWMTAVLLLVENRKGTYPAGGPDLVFSTRITEDPMHLLLMRATSLHLYYNRGMEGYIAGEAARLWAALVAQCEAITGATFQDVLDHNIDKLASRAARGVLKGAGDNR